MRIREGFESGSEPRLSGVLASLQEMDKAPVLLSMSCRSGCFRNRIQDGLEYGFGILSNADLGYFQIQILDGFESGSEPRLSGVLASLQELDQAPVYLSMKGGSGYFRIRILDTFEYGTGILSKYEKVDEKIKSHLSITLKFGSSTLVEMEKSKTANMVFVLCVVLQY